MVTPGSKAYTVKCKSCPWEKNEIISVFVPVPAKVIKLRFNLKCPDCGGKIKVRRNRDVLF